MAQISSRSPLASRRAGLLLVAVAIVLAIGAFFLGHTYLTAEAAKVNAPVRTAARGRRGDRPEDGPARPRRRPPLERLGAVRRPARPAQGAGRRGRAGRGGCAETPPRPPRGPAAEGPGPRPHRPVGIER